MRPAILAACCFVLTASLAFSQAKPEFDVASVKPSAPHDGGGFVVRGGPGTPDPSRVTYSNYPLRALLVVAYGVQPYQVIGPDWMAAARFDVAATIPQGATRDDLKLMLQNLLADRFHLTLHHEPREFPSYELTIGTSGPKMKRSVEDSKPPPGQPSPNGRSVQWTPRRGGLHLAARELTLAMFAQILSSPLQSPVVDKTGLSGTYDFVLDFTLEPGPGAGPALPPAPPPAGGRGVPVASPTPPQDEAPSIFAAVQEQLGLRLEKKKGPVDVLVIDHADKVPTEN